MIGVRSVFPSEGVEICAGRERKSEGIVRKYGWSSPMNRCTRLNR